MYHFHSRVCTCTWKPGNSWNLKIWIPGLESPGIFVVVLESHGIWTYRSIFLIISLYEFSRYTSSEIWMYLCALKVHEFIEKVLEFDIGRSWKLSCQNVYEPCFKKVISVININYSWFCFPETKWTDTGRSNIIEFLYFSIYYMYLFLKQVLFHRFYLAMLECVCVLSSAS